MPAELWARAVVLARASGTYAIARALRVDYQSLARRVAEDGGERAEAARSGGGFVELRGADLLGGATVVEASDVDGARLTIRFGAGAEFDAAAMLGAFRRRDG